MIVQGNKPILKGSVSVAGDKSISHRSVILGALAEGDTLVEGFLPGEDCLSSIDCLTKLGVKIRQTGQKVHIKGAGIHGLKMPDEPLYVGNSGTTMRILSGILAAQNFKTILDGDSSIRKRPMKRVIEPLQSMGAMISYQKDYKAPLFFLPPEKGQLLGGRYDLKVASAQVKSALLLAGLYSKIPVTVKEPVLSRDHTERMLKDFGVELQENDDNSITMPTKQKLTGCKINVPGDISSAAFVLVAAAICPGSQVTVKNVGLNPTRTGIIDVLQSMGADLTIEITSNGAEPAGDITLKYKELVASDIIKGAIIPRLIDEIPAIAILAATAKGTTVIKDAGELRVKESDRIVLMVEILKRLGVIVKETDDGMEIIGSKKDFLPLKNIEVAGDHRIAMSAAIAALVASDKSSFDDQNCIDVSFPGFIDVMQKLGGNMQEGV